MFELKIVNDELGGDGQSFSNPVGGITKCHPHFLAEPHVGYSCTTFPISYRTLVFALLLEATY